MEQNKTGKYFKYAIGEIILVMAGILLALQVNNWNEDRKIKNEEINILIGLKKDFQIDILEFKIDIRAYMHISTSADFILKRMESSAVYNDSLDSYFSRTVMWPKSIMKTASFDVLKSKGLDLISNDSLREEILYFHGQAYTAIKAWEDEINRDIYFDEILKRFDKVEPWTYDKDGNFHFGAMKPINYNTLKTDTLYLSLLKTMKRDAEFIRYALYSTLIEDLESLVINIDKELANLE